MINYDSIISAYNDKPTLMEWLKKVEEALKGASATSFSVNKKGNATISFQIDFEDGTSLESGDIILQQGESVASAAIVNGHLVLTLTNGDELDAGDLGAVSSFSIDASQHLIVTYQDGTTNDLGAIFNGNVNISGTLSASVSISTPKITSGDASIEAEKPIIEKMTGYSFVADSGAIPPVVVFKYIGVVKTGNKLTFAILVELTPNEDWAANSGHRLGKFIVPSAIFSALKTTTIGGLQAVSVQKCYAYSSINADVSLDLYFQKLNSGEISPVLYPDSQMSMGTKYTLRTELTFLLSESLVS